MSKLSKAQLRKMILTEMHDMSSGKEHRCFDGEMVPFGSPECIADIEMRIDDATAQRDGCGMRTDSRGHYNGVLRTLRRDLSSANKEAQIMHPTVEDEPALQSDTDGELEDALEDLILKAL